MSYFAVTYHYRETEIINQVRPSHREYTGSLAKAGSLICSGPLLGTNNALLVFKADSADEVEHLISQDPMKINEIIESYDVIEWNPVTGIFAS